MCCEAPLRLCVVNIHPPEVLRPGAVVSVPFKQGCYVLKQTQYLKVSPFEFFILQQNVCH